MLSQVPIFAGCTSLPIPHLHSQPNISTQTMPYFLVSSTRTSVCLDHIPLPMAPVPTVQATIFLFLPPFSLLLNHYPFPLSLFSVPSHFLLFSVSSLFFIPPSFSLFTVPSFFLLFTVSSLFLFIHCSFPLSFTHCLFSLSLYSCPFPLSLLHCSICFLFEFLFVFPVPV